jgi:hypothetical protein
MLNRAEERIVPAALPMSRRDQVDETVKQRSGWLIPIAVFVVTAVLSAVILLLYLAPTPQSFLQEHPSPTSRADPIDLSVNGLSLKIPANFIIYSSARQGGPRKDVALFTTFPDFRGYSDWEASNFTSNAADSPVIYMLIREEVLDLSEEERLQRIYLTYVADPAAKPGPFGLTDYAFRDDSGYHGKDLFVGQGTTGPVVMLCDRFSQLVPNPSCLRDVRLKHGVALSYRFKRAHLANWHEIADGIGVLVQSFRRPKSG